MKKKHLFIRIAVICGIVVAAFALTLIGYVIFKQQTNPLKAMFNQEQHPTPTIMDESVRQKLQDELGKLNPSSSSTAQSEQPILTSTPIASPIETTTAVPTPTASATDAHILPAATKNSSVKEPEYTDIMVLGVDSRELQLESQTDMILVVRIYLDGRIRIASISRDIYLKIPGYTENRINEACVYGGPALVMKTLNQAFGLAIKDYIVFDFKTAEKIIDLVGKITVNIDEDELDAINGCISELNLISKDDAVESLTHTGSQALNGRQAVAYARLRPNRGSNMTRMDRQKEILNSLISSTKKLKAGQVLSVANKAFDVFYSNISLFRITSLASDLYKVKDKCTQKHLTIPVPSSYKEVTYVEMRYLVINMEKNKAALKDFLEK